MLGTTTIYVFCKLFANSESHLSAICQCAECPWQILREYADLSFAKIGKC